MLQVAHHLSSTTLRWETVMELCTCWKHLLNVRHSLLKPPRRYHGKTRMLWECMEGRLSRAPHTALFSAFRVPRSTLALPEAVTFRSLPRDFLLLDLLQCRLCARPGNKDVFQTAPLQPQSQAPTESTSPRSTHPHTLKLTPLLRTLSTSHLSCSFSLQLLLIL